MIDPLNLIVTALTSGAAAVSKDAASLAVKDAYAALKELVKKRLPLEKEKALDESTLQKPEAKSDISEQLAATAVARDEEVIAAARRVLEAQGLWPGAERARATTQINIDGDVYGQVHGDHNQITLNFGRPPSKR